MRDLIKRILKEETSKPIRVDVNSLKATQTFWDWLRYHEGNPKQKGEPMLNTYKDSVGINTIGYGHTGEYAKSGNSITKEKANQLFIKDVNEAAACVKRFLKEWKEQNVKDKYIWAGIKGVRESQIKHAEKEGVGVCIFSISSLMKRGVRSWENQP